jgi:4-hydroxy-4-methyl-2-oxoglutarate aldolase
VPITVGGTAVRAGDIIVADDDGVLCVPREDADAVLAASDQRVEREAASRAAYQSGQLSLDRNDLRGLLADLGVDYIPQTEYDRV